MAGKLMHAMHCERQGGIATLKQVEVPVPVPKKNEVLLKIEAASINPVDWKIPKSTLGRLLPFSHIPCTDVAGEVVKLGSGVTKFKEGDKVVAILSHFNGGGLAEFAVTKEDSVVARPHKVSAADTAALPIAGLTAYQALTKVAGIRLDKEGEPKNILITAASGGVGHYAVQLAKLGNTHVTATCGARNIEFVKGLGADEVLDYKTQEGRALRSPSGRKYNAVLHCAVDIPWSVFEPNLTDNGKVIDLTPSFGGAATSAMKALSFSKKRLVLFLLASNAEELGVLVRLVEEGKVRTFIDSKYPLNGAVDAWARSISGHATGKIIVEP